MSQYSRSAHSGASQYSTLDNLDKPTNKYSTNSGDVVLPSPPSYQELPVCLQTVNYIESNFPATRDISGCQHNWVFIPYQTNDGMKRGVCSKCYLYSSRSMSKLGGVRFYQADKNLIINLLQS